jgi:hypothetical protein
MMMYVVTVKLPKNPAHNPRDKKTGVCPVVGGICTDQTGEHHSYLDTTSVSPEEAERRCKEVLGFDHVTRIEEVF